MVLYLLLILEIPDMAGNNLLQNAGEAKVATKTQQSAGEGKNS